MNVTSLIITVLLLHSALIAGQAQQPFQGNNFSSDEKREKVYLHTDKDFYQSGETIWLKAYLVDAKTNIEDTQSTVVYIDLLDAVQNPVCSIVVNTATNKGAGNMIIPADLKTGEYILRAYSKYMTNFDTEWLFYKRLRIEIAESNVIANRTKDSPERPNVFAEEEIIPPKTALQFFPEGGCFVNNFVNRVAFKAVDANGKGIEVNGVIADQTGNELISFRTKKFGLGELNFAPHKGETYKVRYSYNNQNYNCDFPATADSGTIMQVIERKDNFSIVIRSSLTHGIKNFQIIGRQSNKIVSSTKLEGSKNEAKVEIQKKLLNPGIIQFTLFNNKGTPVCERLAFVEPVKSAKLAALTALKNEYESGDSIRVNVSISAVLQTKQNGNLSVSVVNAAALKNTDDAMNIQSYLWLASDLKGEIEHPSYYLFSNDPERKNMLDLLMMTQGWRQFIINDTVCAKRLKFLPERGLRFSGHVKRFAENGKPAKATVSLVYSNKLEDIYYETTTDETGYFEFNDLDFVDSTKVIIQAKRTGTTNDIKDPQKNFVIVLDTMNLPKITQNKFYEDITGSNEGSVNQVENMQNKTQDDVFQVQKGDILIDEVLVTEKKKNAHQEKRTMYYEPSYSVDFKEIRKYEGSSNLIEVLKQRTSSRIFNEQLSVGGDSVPLTILNGMPISYEAALSIPTADIDFVDILEGPKTIVYGSSGAGGVIAIYTLDGSDAATGQNKTSPKSILNFMHPGFCTTRKFYEPAFPSLKYLSHDNLKPITIYWNPSVNFDDESHISFIAPPVSGKYQITVEGITSEGEPIHNAAEFQVK